MTKHWRNNEEMGVWDPGEKTAVFRQIKKLIFARYRALKEWAVCLYPGKRLK
jgi:hypothetical protein